ncbi:hypothetical protein [Nocardia sp. NPDC051570]|uniref:hypothetical protein n=1 Tax=Nocardia sp. NPDC051570 TaxID=3364324 RepID=UPI0037A9E0D8
MTRKFGERIRSKAMVAQELSAEQWITIPQPIIDVYAMSRPTPLIRAVAHSAGIGREVATCAP